MFFMFVTCVTFHANWMLFTIRSINLFLIYNLDYKNLKFKYFIDEIVIDFWSIVNLTSTNDIRKKICNPIIDLWKFTFNKKYIKGLFGNHLFC